MNKPVLAAMSALMMTLSLPLMAQETPHAGYRETGSERAWIGIYSPDRGLDQPTASCAIYSRPVNASVFEQDRPVDALRGELAAFIAWNGDGVSDTRGEISFLIGAPVQEGRHELHGVTVGETRFQLVGVGDRLYVQPEDDAAAVRALRGGTEMVVTAQTADGKVVKDSYSLMGVQSMTEIQKAECR